MNIESKKGEKFSMLAIVNGLLAGLILAILGAIIGTSFFFGFVASIGVAVLVTGGFFLYNYSKISNIRYISTGASIKSRVVRNSLHDAWLSTHTDSIAIYGLQGYIFFGTTNDLSEEIIERINDNRQMPLDSIIFDFCHVTAIDSSAIQAFHKLYLQLLKKNIVFIFTQIPPEYKETFQKIGLNKKFTKGFAEFLNLDDALEWRENCLLENSDLPQHQSCSMLRIFSKCFKDKSKAAILLQYLKRIELLPNAKIIQQDCVANDLFFIESGRLSAYLEQEGRLPIRLQTVLDDSIIGEIGFYLNELCTATVIAEAPSIVYRLSKEALVHLEKEQPDVALALHKLLVEKTAKRFNHFSNSAKVLL